MNARKLFLLVILFLILLSLPLAARYAAFYVGRPIRPEVVRPALDQIKVPTPPAAQHSDEKVIAGDGIVVVDMAHENQISMPELNVLAGRLAARGHQFSDWTGGSLETALRQASAFVVAVPLESYSQDEIAVVRDFVETGGRLLLIGDPTRYSYQVDDWGWIIGIDSDARYLNSLSGSFGITYVDDYLYNVSDNEGNFRNIKLDDWGESVLTEGLDMVVFYAAHSLGVAEETAVILAGNDTWSSATDRAGGLVVAAQTTDGKVLALGDLTFMTEPYHTVRDNSRLIAQIADFLTAAERSYFLPDFPLFFGEKVALVLVNSPEIGTGQLQIVDKLEGLFEENDQLLVLVDEPDSRTDTIYAGIYSQADLISDTLAGFGVTLVYTPTEMVEEEQAPPSGDLEEEAEEGADKENGEPEEEDRGGRVEIDGLGSYDMSGIGAILYQLADEQEVLIVLAASQEGLAALLDLLAAGNLDACVVSEPVLLCPTGISMEEIEPSWEPIEAVPEEEPGSDEEDEEDEEEPPPSDGVQGSLDYGDSVSDILKAEEEHIWTFEGEAGDLVTIRVETESSDMDLVLSLEDAEGNSLSQADSNLSGMEEEIRNYELQDDGEYRIRVADFWEEGGDYTLSLALGTEAASAGGAISFGETVAGELELDQEAVWTFTGQAEQAVTIILQPDADSDMYLELTDEEGKTLDSSDNGYSGEEERIEGRLPADGTYRIVAAEYYGDPATYELTLLEGGEGGILGGWGIMIISADTGVAGLEGRTSAEIYYELLAPDYDVTLWVISEDGEPDLDEMQDRQLVVWSSGDFKGEEEYILFSYLFEGGSLLLSGAYPGLYEGEETAILRDLEVSSVPSDLTRGFQPGEIIAFPAEFEAVVFDSSEEEDGMLPVFLRGPNSEESGDVIAAGIQEGMPGGLHVLLIGFPFYMLPDAAQTQLVDNAMEWFDISPLP